MGVDFSGISLPFTAADLLTSATGLLTVVGPFVLLGLAFVVAPYLINLVKGSARKGSSKN